MFGDPFRLKPEATSVSGLLQAAAVASGFSRKKVVPDTLDFGVHSSG
jgi:hypothetical protein